jgi:hypothetical protein
MTERPASPRSGRLIALAFSAWRRSSKSADTWQDGSISPSPTNINNWDTAQGNALGALGRGANKLIALAGTLMGGYADDLFNISYRMEHRTMVAEGFAYGGQERRDFQELYGVFETIENVPDMCNACPWATKKIIHVLKKPGASPLLFGKLLMSTTAFLSLEDIADNLPRYDESADDGKSICSCCRFHFVVAYQRHAVLIPSVNVNRELCAKERQALAHLSEPILCFAFEITFESTINRSISAQGA